MRVTLRLQHVVAVIGGRQRHAQFLAHTHQTLVDRSEFGDGMVLQLEVVIVAKDVLVPASGVIRLFLVAGQQVLRHLRVEAAGEGDKPFAVLGQHLPVHAGLVIETVQLRFRGELNEVAPAGLIFG